MLDKKKTKWKIFCQVVFLQMHKFVSLFRLEIIISFPCAMFHFSTDSPLISSPRGSYLHSNVIQFWKLTFLKELSTEFHLSSSFPLFPSTFLLLKYQYYFNFTRYFYLNKVKMVSPGWLFIYFYFTLFIYLKKCWCDESRRVVDS